MFNSELSAKDQRATSASNNGGMITISASIVIQRPPPDVYVFWRKFENLPRFIPRLESVTLLGERSSYWVIRSSLGQTWASRVDIIEDRAPREISWKTPGGIDIEMGGTVNFEATDGGKGTALGLTLCFPAPIVPFFAELGRTFVNDTRQSIGDDLARLKTLLESAGKTPNPANQVRPSSKTQWSAA